MGFLQNIFGSKDPLSALRRAAKQQRWADVLREDEVIDRGNLSVEMIEELQNTLTTAGDCLAELNLTEGEACLRCDDRERAREHFQLAAVHARSDALKARAKQLLENGLPTADVATVNMVAKSCCSSGCHAPAEPTEDPADDMDMELRLELALASYPPELAVRYKSASSLFKQALLLAYAEEDGAEALKAFDAVSKAEQDDLYQFERGSLLLRLGDGAQGRRCLQRAVELNPEHHLALETLVTVDLLEKQFSKAESRLRKMLSDGISPTFCLSRLAQLAAGKNNVAAAIEFGEQALASGPVEMEILILLSTLLEKSGRIAEAESVLSALPSGGCGGGAHYLLAEFWLRHNKSLNQALESFKSISRQEPTNLRWPLRMAHTYFALKWNKDGQVLLNKILAAPDLHADLRKDAEEILSIYGK